MRETIRNNLSIGDSKSKIEEFLNKQDWSYAYDEDLNRFEARDLKEDNYPKHHGRNMIYIYTDDEDRFVDFEVIRIHQGL